MSSLLPNNHRSASDRLLSNYLTSQKQLTTALLTLLSHSHSSTSSLLAYVTSSPGIPFPVRRAVQNAAFEGPISSSSVYPAGLDQSGDDAKWTGYVASLEHFRKDLKEVHVLEEELSQVKRDREILVSRLIKATKSRPTKNDIRDAAKSSGGGGRDGSSSVLSFGSDGSGATAGGRSKRASKLAEAQAEVLGCEEHLRDLEVRLEEERSKVMRHGLLERFRAMEEVGRMWQKQARLGITELERANGHDTPLLPPNAFEVDSNGSLAPSQSASQVGGYTSDPELVDSPRRSAPKKARSREDLHAARRAAHPPPVSGSVTGSIAEEDENELGSSASEDEGNFVVHENARPGLGSRSASTLVPQQAQSHGGQSNFDGRLLVGQGVPSITAMRPSPLRQYSNASSDHRVAQPRRRTQSEVGYNPPKSNLVKRQSLRRSASHTGSDNSSIRRKKKGGFFSAIAKLFKSSPSGAAAAKQNRRNGADSPTMGNRNKNGWQTRTDEHLKRANTVRGARRSANDSSDDEQPSNLVAVTNMGNQTWSVDNVGKTNGNAVVPRKTKSDMGSKARSEASTITPSSRPGTLTKAAKPATRSNTVKSTASAASKRTRDGSITRAGGRPASAAYPNPSIESVIEGNGAPPGPKMMEIPKAPRSMVTPQMYSVTAPPPVSSTSLHTPAALPPSASAPSQLSSKASASTVTAPQQRPANLKRASSSGSKVPSLAAPVSSGPAMTQHANESLDSLVVRQQTPLPPSKSLAPPSKSILRSPSPVPGFMVVAPPPVVADKPVEPEHAEPEPTSAAPLPSPMSERPNTPMTETDSIYESAMEEDEPSVAVHGGEAPAVTNGHGTGYGGGDSESEEGSDSTADPTKYRVVENAPRASGIPPAPVELDQASAARPKPAALEADHLVAASPASVSESTLERRKSVRMAVPDSPAAVDTQRHSRVEMPSRSNGQANGEPVYESGWSSKVGRQADSSDEEDNAEYAKAKLSLTSSTRKMASAGRQSSSSTKKKTKSRA